MRDHGVVDLNYLNLKDDRFVRVRKSIDAQMKLLTEQGYGCETKQAEPISPDPGGRTMQVRNILL